ncbi:NAD(P)H-binding protein [Mycobacterium sp. NPDC006124]|uniref:NAD(P)H-binding protein n=1 Tax=Mycobacterium sp. NPDC006124 TaxID=3156729 RepID=UPI0033A977AB
MSDTESRRSLVTGATGYIGGHLTALLVERGENVRAMARTPEKLRDAPWRDQVEVVRGDLGDPQTLEAAFDGVDVVYYLVHSMGTSRDFVREEEKSAHNVAAAAEKAGVRRIVYLSGLHPDGELSRHLRSRNTVGEILMASSVETVVLQAGIVIGSGSASFEMVRHLTDRLPVMTTPKWVRNKIQPISIDDVLYYLAECADAPLPKSRTFDVGCPDVLEYADAMQIYAEEAGLRRRFIIALPLLTPSIASWWVGLVTPIPSGLARPLVESLEHDAVMSEHDIDGVVPPPPGGLTNYRESVRLALESDGTTGKGRRHLIRFSSTAPQ